MALVPQSPSLPGDIGQWVRGEPLWKVVPKRDGAGRAYADFMMMAPGLNLETSVGRARVCGFRVVWQGATTRRGGPRKEEQHRQAARNPCNRVRSGPHPVGERPRRHRRQHPCGITRAKKRSTEVSRLKGRSSQEMAVVARVIHGVLARFGEGVAFADFNVNLRVLWVSLQCRPGLMFRVVGALRVHVPELKLVAHHPNQGGLIA